MKKIYWSLFVLVLISTSCQNSTDQTEKYFSNPILAGFYPDPSICRVDDDYYLVNSTFSYFPGLPIFHSKDLVNWNQIGHVMTNPETFDTNGLGVSRGMFAPVIRYHDGLFYVVCTFVGGNGNFIVTAENPQGPWTDPVWFQQIDGIDPSLFFDDDGKSFIVYNSVAPDNNPLYDGHRTIRMHQLDLDNLQLKGSETLLVNGGVDIALNPVWIEAPHIIKKDGYYYLIAAEGGTGYNHSEVVFRSDKVDGPYIPSEKNPILTQRHLDPSRPNPITTTGHADFVQTKNGDWWAVFLGCRPYEDDYYNTGRETFMVPVIWEDGWPVMNPGFEEVQYSYPLPMPTKEGSSFPYSGNFTVKDEFDSEDLHLSWVFLRTPKEKWYGLDSRKGYLAIQLRPETSSEKGNPSFIGRRQQHLNGNASTAIEFEPKSENEKAGLMIFQNENHYYFLCKSLEGTDPVVQLYKAKPGDNRPNEQMELLASRKLKENNNPVYLKIEALGDTYAFYYAVNEGEWQLIKDGMDAKYLSTLNAGGFVGCMYAMYATSLGKPSENSAYFDWFEYEGDDDVFRPDYLSRKHLAKEL